MTFEKDAIVLEPNRRLGVGLVALAVVMAGIGIAETLVLGGTPNLQERSRR